MPVLPLSPGVDLNYVVDDYTDPWTKPETILLCHGNNESHRAWYGWVPHLARHYRVVRPDMRGFGDSTPMKRDFPWTLDGVIEDYIKLMDYLGVAKFHLVGAKIGGVIGLGIDQDDNVWVYGRRQKPCRKCGTPIEYKKMGLEARSTYWCPRCQRISQPSTVGG